LGLPICREIVTAHGGVVWVEDRDGGGSVFHVLLPAPARQALPPEPAAAMAIR
jgi:two-component system, OmpR family, sensor histidine kinase KdpD